MTAAVLVVLTVAAGALTRGPRVFRPELMLDRGAASERVFARFLSDGCAPCVVSKEGFVTARDLPRWLSQPAARTNSLVAATSDTGRAHQRPLQLNLAPGRDAAGTTLEWKVQTAGADRALLELHAGVQRPDPGVALTIRVFDHRGEVAARDIRGDELGPARVVVPLYFGIDPSSSDVRIAVVYGGRADVQLDRLALALSGRPS